MLSQKKKLNGTHKFKIVISLIVGICQLFTEGVEREREGDGGRKGGGGREGEREERERERDRSGMLRDLSQVTQSGVSIKTESSP